MGMPLWFAGADDLEVDIKLTLHCANPQCIRVATVQLDMVPDSIDQVVATVPGWLVYTDEDAVCGPECLHKMYEYYG